MLSVTRTASAPAPFPCPHCTQGPAAQHHPGPGALSHARDAPVGPRSAVTCPSVTPVLRYFLEYQWFVDFAVYSTAVYVFTEGYYCLADPQKETNIGVLWCLLTVVFSMYPSAGFRGAIAATRRVRAANGWAREPAVLLFSPH